jgi:hypothetical protein
VPYASPQSIQDVVKGKSVIGLHAVVSRLDLTIWEAFLLSM